MMSQGELAWTSGLIPMIEPEIVTEIISRIADLALVITGEGKVLGVLSNPNFKVRLPVPEWEGQLLTQFLTVESVPKFLERLGAFVGGEQATVRPVELNHSATEAQQELPMRYSFHRIGTDGALLMLGQDLRPVAEMQQQLVAAQIALEKDYEAQRERDTRLRVLMNATADGAMFVSMATGEIIDCNPSANAMLGKSRDELLGHPLESAISHKNKLDVLQEAQKNAGGQGNSDLPVKTVAGRELVLRPTVFRVTGEQMMLCQLFESARDGMGNSALDGHLASLFDKGPDGIVFINKAGNILSANDAFLRLTDVVHAQSIRGRTITEFFGRGSVDLNVICENATRTGAMRLYATRLQGENGVELPVEIATTVLSAGTDAIFALVLRDASRAEMVRQSHQQITDVDMRSVIELIGSQTLKSIVAKTTDVIEKMCIETAVELTSNNRVAAAEMLGLSRQSLYVKLRKYDLLNKDQGE